MLGVLLFGIINEEFVKLVAKGASFLLNMLLPISNDVHFGVLLLLERLVFWRDHLFRSHIDFSYGAVWVDGETDGRVLGRLLVGLRKL